MKTLINFFAGGIIGLAIIAAFVAWVMWPAFVFGRGSIEHGAWLFAHLFVAFGLIFVSYAKEKSK